MKLSYILLFITLITPARATDEVAAKIGEYKIYQKELDKMVVKEKYLAAKNLFEFKKNLLDGLILERLIKQDPRRKKVSSSEEFINKYIVSSMEISEAEIEAFARAQGFPAGQLNPAIKERIRFYIGNSKRNLAISSWRKEQMKKIKVKTFLRPPQRPMYKPHPEGGFHKGKKDAPIHIVEYADFQCPHCRVASEKIRDLMEKYPDKIRVSFKNMPIDGHPQAKYAAQAGYCIDEQHQGDFWPFHHFIFKHQQSLTLDLFKKYMNEMSGKKYDVKKFTSCLEEGKYKKRVNEDQQNAIKQGFKATPVILVNNQMIVESITKTGISAFEKIIEEIAPGVL